jgi:hypothetical protein
VRKHAVVFVDVERHESTDGADAVEGVEKEPVMFRERHHASIMEFENFSSVKASIRRSTRGDECVDQGIYVLDARIERTGRDVTVFRRGEPCP